MNWAKEKCDLIDFACCGTSWQLPMKIDQTMMTDIPKDESEVVFKAVYKRYTTNKTIIASGLEMNRIKTIPTEPTKKAVE